MKRPVIAVLTMVLVSSAFGAEEPAKGVKSAPASSPRKYEPLIIPGEQGSTATPVPSNRQDISKDQEKDSAAYGGVDMSSGGSRLIIPIEAEKEKKQQLWIYTLPEENAARKKDREEDARRVEQSQEAQKSKQLPDWAIDPAFRKYFVPDVSQNSSQSIPGTDTSALDRGPFDLRKKSEADGEDFSAPYSSTRPSSFEDPTRVTLPGGTSLSTGREATEVKSGNKFEAGYLTKPEAEAPAKKTDYNQLYQSNQKEKKVEDFYDGLNKPVKVEKADDRYHKPQKPL